MVQIGTAHGYTVRLAETLDRYAASMQALGVSESVRWQRVRLLRRLGEAPDRAAVEALPR
jgi:hypothetical protein